MNNILNKFFILLFSLGFTISICHAVATKIHIPEVVSDCKTQYGYTQMKEIGYRNFVCHNPNTNMSYHYSKFTTSHGSTESTTFYLNGNVCGTDCNYDGKNCKWGICNITSCNLEYGYTELEPEKTKSQKKFPLCHKKGTKLSYRPVNSNRAVNVFYYDGMKCGSDCDMDGRNCVYEGSGLYPMIGICNPIDCPQGYTVQQGYCKNSDTNELFYKDKDGKFKSDNERSKKIDRKMREKYIQLYLQR